MEFMSPEHVTAMNEALAGSDAVRDAARGLGRRVVLLYELADGPHGTTFWSVSLGPDGVVFGLERVEGAEVTLSGDWFRAVDASRAGREGRDADPGVEMHGDPSLLAQVSQVLAVAAQVATLDVEWPDPPPQGGG